MVFFLVPTGQNGELMTDAEKVVSGFFVEREIENLGGLEALQRVRARLLCRLGAERTTSQKKKDRLASVAYTTTTPPERQNNTSPP